LADAPGFFTGNMQRDACGEMRELLFQDLFGGADNHIAEGAGRNASENQNMPQIIEPGVVGKRISEVDSDGFCYPSGCWITLISTLLHVLQPLGQVHSGIKVEARPLRQPVHRLLREIAGADPQVSGPFITGGSLAGETSAARGLRRLVPARNGIGRPLSPDCPRRHRRHCHLLHPRAAILTRRA